MIHTDGTSERIYTKRKRKMQSAKMKERKNEREDKSKDDE